MMGFNVSNRYGMPITCQDLKMLIQFIMYGIATQGSQDYTRLILMQTFINSSTAFVARELPRNNVFRVSKNNL